MILKEIEQTIINLMIKNGLKNYYDIGANPTVKTIKLFDDLIEHDLNIFAFDPHPDAYSRLKMFFQNYIKIYQFGIGNKDERTVLYSDHSDDCLSSFSEEFMKKKTGLDVFNKYECSIIRLDTFMINQNLPAIDIIKIDVEDWENQVIEGIPLESEPVILIEYHSKEVRLAVEDLLRGKYNQNIFFNYGSNKNIVRYFVYTSVNKTYKL